MSVYDDNDRKINKYNSDMEDVLAVVRRVYDSLSDARKLLLEQLLRKIVVCTNLLGLTLPSARMNILVLDFDNYGPSAEADMQARPDVWNDDLKEVFAGPNVPLLLPHIYSAIRAWNRGELYAPKHLAFCHEGKYYPVRLADLEKYTLAENIERLVTKANESLSVKGDLMANPSPLDEDGLPPALVDSFD